ncbi:ATP-dependent DNA/RNA helicase DHX36-like [Anthonomus grandis grandis]|uniref:ATP-dependent DNA/RNA helicase DHX36-like n=1 Tax=Anthonomus grandis grandis TaxID=2921223 RepID=UPI002165CBF8|nr:ATP-dependent DNA/RNA helicase DHX36-like [Anthonomus grandis grandis]
MGRRGKKAWRYHKKLSNVEEGTSSNSFGSWRNESQNEVSYRSDSERPPPGTKGRDIGLWYRSRQKKRSLEESESQSSQMSPESSWSERSQVLYEEDSFKAHQHGKDIGLMYRSRQMKDKRHDLEAGTTQATAIYENREQSRKKLNLEKMKVQAEKPLGSIVLSESKKANINQLLNQTERSIYPRSFLEKTNSFEHLEETDFKHEFLQHITGNIIEKLKAAPSTGKQFKNEFTDIMLLDELKKKKAEEGYQRMQKVRKNLPSMDKKDEILDMIQKNQITVISGETGCGKTTQVAQFILDHYISTSRGSECKIICTQPRRISAISVAERVAQERDEQLGISVGYQIRLEKVAPRERGSILFCTTGVLLKYMESNPSLKDVSHLILDEIHERDVTCDFLITLLKDVIRYRTDIKVILMSATLNAEAFSKYFNGAPHINIPGFTWPVQQYFLEDVLQLTDFKFVDDSRPIWVRKMNSKKDRAWSDSVAPFIRQLEAEGKYKQSVIAELWKPNSEKQNNFLIYTLILKICQEKYDGAILVFVPGFADIQFLVKKMQESGNFPASKYLIFPLHSQLPTMDQKQIFQTPPKGMRKIIISTNIAETSITIDDVTCVIDSGYIKISNLDLESGIETLQPELVSQANAAQRKGRAGRVKPGTCYHLITKYRYDMLDKFLKPEVLRKRLESVILTLKMLQLGEAEPFLSRLMDPPQSKSIQSSLALLQRMGALTDEEGLTPLGFHMAKLPVGPHCSKMLIMASLFSCVDPVLSVAASLGFKDAFQLSTSESKEADKMKYQLSGDSYSDHITMHYAISGYEEADNKWAFCRKYYLSSSILKLLIDMKQQFARELFDMHFIKDPHPKSHSSNLNSNNMALVKAIIAAGLYPNVAIITKQKAGKRPSMLRSIDYEKMQFHPKSVMNYVEVIPSPLLVYFLRLKSIKLYVHEATIVFPLSIVFFGDKYKIHSDEQSKFKGISINDNMRFICTESTAMLIQRLREHLNEILEWKVSHPGFVDWSSSTPETQVLRVIMDLIRTEDSGDFDLSDFEDD